MAMDSAKRGEIMELAKQQIAVANAQELLSKMTQRCFKKCVNKPGYSLDSSEQKCISMCMDRFMDSWDLISRAYVQRIQREQQNQ